MSNRTGLASPETVGDPVYPVSVLCVNADQTRLILDSHAGVAQQRYRIGLWSWELEDFPEWLHDAFGNSIALASFRETAEELSFHSSFRAEHFPLPELSYELEPYARSYPFSYSLDDIPDLSRTMERHYVDPDHVVDKWARQVVAGVRSRDTVAILVAMTQTIKAQFEYVRREQMQRLRRLLVGRLT